MAQLHSKVLILLALVFIVYGQTPARPNIPDSFDTLVNITITDNQGHHVGNGHWGTNQPAGRGIETYKFQHSEYDNTIIERYDLGSQYFVENGKCQTHKINGTMPKAWDWVALAKFIGTSGSGSGVLDIWQADIGYATLRVGVYHSNPNTPVYLIRGSRDERKTEYHFATWTPSAPVDSVFQVPSSCSQSTNVIASDACVARATAISRAKVWVANKVPYNQGATYEGYREDCSGYVSMCWESAKPGHTTSTMHEIAKPISKDDLQPGDCLLYAAEHVVLFGGWTKSDKSEYQAYEETRPGEGTVTRPTPYPYWYSQSSFKPYRYDDIC